MKKIMVLITAIVVFVAVNVSDVKAVDYETALKLQQEATDNYYAMLQNQQAAGLQQGAVNALTMQQQMIADTQAAAAQAAKAQQDAVANAILAQQQAIEAQQKAIADAQAAALQAIADTQAAAMQAAKAEQEALLRAQQQAIEVSNAIQAANMITPQVEVICDTNCAEMNAALYARTVPDFVLVDISEQRAVFYKNGVRVLGDNCVTGNKKSGYDTTVGIHKIVFKDQNRTLHGSYGEAFVKYWMRFTAGGQGLHDAGWRNNFGNSIYITNGSHGCVNLPRETAKIIYENSYVGMFVIVEN